MSGKGVGQTVGNAGTQSAQDSAGRGGCRGRPGQCQCAECSVSSLAGPALCTPGLGF